MRGSVVKFTCGTMRGEGVLPSTLPVQTTSVKQQSTLPPTLLTYRNSNSAWTYELPRPGKILQDI